MWCVVRGAKSAVGRERRPSAAHGSWGEMVPGRLVGRPCGSLGWIPEPPLIICSLGTETLVGRRSCWRNSWDAGSKPHGSSSAFSEFCDLIWRHVLSEADTWGSRGQDAALSLLWKAGQAALGVWDGSGHLLRLVGTALWPRQWGCCQHPVFLWHRDSGV